MKNLIKYKKGEDSWIRWIKKRLRHNLNFLALFQGPTGSGKTWASISVAQQIDKDFSVDQIVFSFKELMDVINADWFKEKKPKIIIFDEPQVSISNRSWQSTTNKLMNYLASTFRHQNIILLFASPYIDFLDKQTTRLIHCIFECMSIDKKKKTCKLKPLIQQYNSRLKKTYQHPLYVINDKRKLSPLRRWEIPSPTKEMIELYEKKKEEFTSELNKKISGDVNKLSGVKVEASVSEGRQLKYRKQLTERQKGILELLAKGHNQKEAAKILNISQSRLSTAKDAAFKRGWLVDDFVEMAHVHENSLNKKRATKT
jgi:DNA-binding CsgD family transcriptional regulator